MGDPEDGIKVFRGQMEITNDDIYTDELMNRSSKIYKETEKKYSEGIAELYKSTVLHPAFVKTDILHFAR